MMVDSLHISEIPVAGALIKVLQSDKVKKKAVTSAAPMPMPRQRASTLGVITEIQDGTQKQTVPTSASGKMGSNNRLNRSRNLSASSSNSSLHGSDSTTLPVVAGQIKAFGDKAERSHLRIEDRVVVH